MPYIYDKYMDTQSASVNDWLRRDSGLPVNPPRVAPPRYVSTVSKLCVEEAERL